MPTLTLGRKPGQSIELVGTGVVIRFPHKGNPPRIKVSIDAPDTIKIRRSELPAADQDEAPDLLPDETPTPPRAA